MGFKIINDGYTQPGYIAAVAGVHDALDFSYRPMLPEERDEFTRLEGISAEAAHAYARQVLVNNVKTWNVVGDNDNTLPVNDESLKGFRGVLAEAYTKLLYIVAGWRASDPRPGKEPPKPGAEQGAEDAKNS
jgi:hypothetical protein